MSHEMALVMQRLLRRVLRTYEADNSVTIDVPQDVLRVLQLRDSDMAELDKARPPVDRQQSEEGKD